MADEKKYVILADEFRDKDNFDKVYKKGEEHEFSKERAEGLLNLGFIGERKVQAKPTAAELKAQAEKEKAEADAKAKAEADAKAAEEAAKANR